MLTPQAAADISGMAAREAHIARQSLAMLRINPALGLKLWGQDDLYLFQTINDDRIIYRMISCEIQVLSITPQAAALGVIDYRSRISGLVLAAGHTAYADTMPFSNLAETFLSAGVDDLIMVVGDHADQARAELKRKDVTIVVDTDYEEGLSKSLRHGLRMLPSETSAVMLSLGNRPFVSREVVSRLIQAYREGGSRVVVPSYSQMRGHPVIFDALLLPELLKVRGNAGGRDVIKHHIKELTQVDVGDAGVLERTWLN
jgi:CTP:molybdopterin cytidylyltransferase MocA